MVAMRLDAGTKAWGKKRNGSGPAAMVCPVFFSALLAAAKFTDSLVSIVGAGRSTREMVADSGRLRAALFLRQPSPPVTRTAAAMIHSIFLRPGNGDSSILVVCHDRIYYGIMYRRLEKKPLETDGMKLTISVMTATYSLLDELSRVIGL